MIIDLEKLNAGTWFPLEGGGQICVRVCAGDDYAAIRAQAVKIKKELVFDPLTRQPTKVREEIVDEALQNVLLWDFCIVDWEGLLNTDEQPVPCTKEMKMRLMGKSPTFSKHVFECLEKLRAVEETEAEGQAKN
jgi:hypothetical protein